MAKSKLFDEIFWNLVCRCFSKKQNATKNVFWILSFFGRFSTKKQPKLTKNEENSQNPYRLMKFSKIWYVDASQQQQKCYKKSFLDFGLFWPSFNQKTAKIDQKLRKLAKSKPFDEIFWNLVCRCFPTTTKMLQKTFFWISAFFGRF